MRRVAVPRVAPLGVRPPAVDRRSRRLRAGGAPCRPPVRGHLLRPPGAGAGAGRQGRARRHGLGRRGRDDHRRPRGRVDGPTGRRARPALHAPGPGRGAAARGRGARPRPPLPRGAAGRGGADDGGAGAPRVHTGLHRRPARRPGGPHRRRRGGRGPRRAGPAHRRARRSPAGWPASSPRAEIAGRSAGRVASACERPRRARACADPPRRCRRDATRAPGPGPAR